MNRSGSVLALALLIVAAGASAGEPASTVIPGVRSPGAANVVPAPLDAWLPDLGERHANGALLCGLLGALGFVAWRRRVR